MINKARLIFIALALTCLFTFTFAQDDCDKIPDEVIDYKGDKMQRHHHVFFHFSRALWTQLPPELQYKITQLGWNPPRVTLAFTPDGKKICLKDNNSGQDLFFMHRRAIEAVNKIAEEVGSCWRAVGWDSIPAPGDQDYPAQPSYTVPGNDELTNFLKVMKSDDFYYNAIKPFEDKIKDPEYLRSITLGELGAEIECHYLVLFWRYSVENSVGYRPNSTFFLNEVTDDKWIDPAYNWLGDIFSSQLNPVFWKIYGWVDNQAEAWRKANNIDMIQWVGTWEGGPMETMEYLFDLASKIGRKDSQDDADDQKDEDSKQDDSNDLDDQDDQDEQDDNM